MKFVKYALFILMTLVVAIISFIVYLFVLPSAMSGSTGDIFFGWTVTVLWTLVLLVIVGNTWQHINNKYINPPQ